METKLLELSELLCAIQDMQEKIQLQIMDLKQEYFCYTEANQYFYSRAKITCSIASDYSKNLDYALKEAQAAVENIIHNK